MIEQLVVERLILGPPSLYVKLSERKSENGHALFESLSPYYLTECKAEFSRHFRGTFTVLLLRGPAALCCIKAPHHQVYFCPKRATKSIHKLCCRNPFRQCKDGSYLEIRELCSLIMPILIHMLYSHYQHPCKPLRLTV